MCSKNHIHMYASWDMKCDRHQFLPFFAILTPKIKIWKKCKKKTWRYYPFTHVCHKWRSYEVWFLRYKARQTEFLSCWAIFCPWLTLLATQKNQNFEKMKNPPRRYHHFTHVPKIIIRWCKIPEILCKRDRQMGRWKK